MPQPVTGTISGSRAATVLGVNEWSSQVEVWQKIMEERQPGFNAERGMELPTFEPSAPMRWGTAFESALIACVQDETGEKIGSREKVCKASHFGIPLSCHLDGKTDVKRIYEGKTTSAFVYRLKWTESVMPRTYYLQVQHNIYVAGADSALVAVLVFPEAVTYYEQQGWTIDGKMLRHKDKKPRSLLSFARFLHDMGYLHTYNVQRNDEMIETMLLGYNDFWSFVKTEETPTPTNIKDINRLCPEPKVELLIDTPEAIGLFTEYSEVKEKLGKKGELSMKAEELKLAILNMARKAGMDNNSDTVGFTFKGPDGKTLGSYKKSSRGSWTFRA